MSACILRFVKNDQGATAIEFAIVLPVLLLFVFGIMEWGLYMYNRQVITNAVREGARFGTLMRPAPRSKQDENLAVCNRVMEYADDYLIIFGSDKLQCDEDVNDGDYGFIKIKRLPDNLAFGSNLYVTVENYEYELLLHKILNIEKIPITVEATMKME